MGIVSLGSACSGMPDAAVGCQGRHVKQLHVLDFSNRCDFGTHGEQGISIPCHGYERKGRKVSVEAGT